MVNLEWFKSFIAIYRIGTVSSAAEFCKLTQPAVSQHLSSLEKILENKLFIRTSKRMIPTDKAKELYSQIASSFDILNKASNKIQKSILKPETPILKIGTPLEFFYEKIIQKLTSTPFRLNFEFDITQNLVDKLKNNHLNAIIATQKINSKEIEYRKIYKEEFILIAPNNIKISKYKDLNELEEWLLTQKWISYGADLPIIRRFWQDVFNNMANIQPIIIIPNLHSILKAVELGVGVSILPSYLCQKAIKERSIYTILEPNPPIINELWIGYKKIDKNSENIKTLKSYIKL